MIELGVKMSFETKKNLEMAVIVIGGIILFSLPIFLMGNAS